MVEGQALHGMYPQQIEEWLILKDSACGWTKLD